MPRPPRRSLNNPPPPPPVPTAPTLPERTFVLDNGAYTLKAGFAPPPPTLSASSSSPATITDADSLQSCHQIPNMIARTKDKRTHIGLACNDPSIQWNDAVFRRPMEHGQIVSWEAQGAVWEAAFFGERGEQRGTDGGGKRDLSIGDDAGQTTLILTEAPNGLTSLQRNADEVVMEEFGFGGYVRTIAPGLNAFNDLHPLFGDTTDPISTSAPSTTPPSPSEPHECLLIIDSGFSHTTITPCYRGRPIQRAIRKIDFGGKHLTTLLREVVSVRHADLSQDLKVVNDLKEDVCFVSAAFGRDMQRSWVRVKVPRGVAEEVGRNGSHVRRKEMEEEGDGKGDDHNDGENGYEDDAMDVDHHNDTSNGSGLQQDTYNDPTRHDPVVDYILPDFVTRMRGAVATTYPSITEHTIAQRRRRLHNRLAANGHHSNGIVKTHDAQPTENVLTLGNETFTTPEIIFTPSILGSSQPGLSSAVMQSLATLPPALQATFLANVLCVGGTAALPGFTQRLQSEVRASVRDDWPVRVRRMKDPVGSTWLGGVRASWDRTESGVVRRYGVTREMYEEDGWVRCARRFAGLVDRD